MFRQLTILKSILIIIVMIKHHPHLDMVRILIVYIGNFLEFLLLPVADIQSTNKVEKNNDPSSDTDVETQTHHSISKGGIYKYCFVMNVLFTYNYILMYST